MKEKIKTTKVTDDSALQKPVTAKTAAKKRATVAKKASAAKKAMKEFGANSKQATEAVEAYSKAEAEADKAEKRVRKPAAKTAAPKKRRAVTSKGVEVGEVGAPEAVPVPEHASGERPLAEVVQKGAATTAEVLRVVRAIEDDSPTAAPKGSEADDLMHEHRMRELKSILSGSRDMPYNRRSDVMRGERSSLSNRNIHALNAADRIRQCNASYGAQLVASRLR